MVCFCYDPMIIKGRIHFGAYDNKVENFFSFPNYAFVPNTVEVRPIILCFIE